MMLISDSIGIFVLCGKKNQFGYGFSKDKQSIRFFKDIGIQIIFGNWFNIELYE